MKYTPLTPAEIFGLTPLPLRLRQFLLGAKGDKFTPKTKADLSALQILKPRLSAPLWLGKKAKGRLIPVYNLFNHLQPDLKNGFRLSCHDVLDFRGKKLSYDSHNGTDMAVPPGTPVAASAPGKVLRISNEFHRGGLKIFIDHGNGLATTYNHLGRALCQVGDTLARGEVFALSGASGADSLLMFPFTTPHVHMNVWLNGVNVDPFARATEKECSMWIHGNDPAPSKGDEKDEPFVETLWSEEKLALVLNNCLHEESRSDICSGSTLAEKSMNALMQMNYFPSRFKEITSLYEDEHPRKAIFTLPFLSEDFDGLVFPDHQ